MCYVHIILTRHKEEGFLNDRITCCDVETLVGKFSEGSNKQTS